MSRTNTKDEINLEHLSDLSLALWRESSLDRLIRRFVCIQKEEFGLKQATLTKFNFNSSPITWQYVAMQINGIESIENKFTEELCNKILLTNILHTDYKQGVNKLSVQSEDFWCVFITDYTLLVWKAELSTKQLEVVEFLGNQIQTCSRWFFKLDKTQSKLYKDDLTGLYNMRYLDILLEAEIRRSQRFKTEFCLLFIDLDGFKGVNDQFGHSSGSGVLKQMASVLALALREVDTVFRYGGDEFIVLLLGANLKMGHLAGERIRRKIEKNNFKTDMGKDVKLTASIGVASYPANVDSKEDLLRIADEAMYRSKRSGKNKVVVCSSPEVTA